MAKLYFKYGCMNSSKSANLLMIKHNYEEQGFKVLLLKPSIDNREGSDIIKSRVGISADCYMIGQNESVTKYIKDEEIIMVDESQFLTKEQVNQLHDLSFNRTVLCFGLLTDFRQELFEGSTRLIELADSIQEIKTVCGCGGKASVNARFSNGKLVTAGEKIHIGGNEQYKALCKICYSELKERENGIKSK